jgi:hypothetical protein
MARERNGFGQGRVLVQRLVLAEVLARRGEGPLTRPVQARIFPGRQQQTNESPEPEPEEPVP